MVWQSFSMLVNTQLHFISESFRGWMTHAQQNISTNDVLVISALTGTKNQLYRYWRTTRGQDCPAEKVYFLRRESWHMVTTRVCREPNTTYQDIKSVGIHTRVGLVFHTATNHFKFSLFILEQHKDCCRSSQHPLYYGTWLKGAVMRRGGVEHIRERQNNGEVLRLYISHRW